MHVTTGDDGGGDVGGGNDGGVKGSGDGGGGLGGGGRLGDGGGGLFSVRSNDGAEGQNNIDGGGDTTAPVSELVVSPVDEGGGGDAWVVTGE